MIDDANPIDSGPIDDEKHDAPANDDAQNNAAADPDAFPGDTDDLNLTEADAEALRVADAAIDAEDANRINGGRPSAGPARADLGDANDDTDSDADTDAALADPDLAGSLDEDVDEYANEFLAAMATQQKAADDQAEAPKFYEATADLHALDDLTLTGRPSVLERLGPAHFRSKGFSFMGFLQTVYDHVATEVKTKNGTAGEATPPADPPREPSTPA